jgi:hypothetical protein
MNCTLKERQSNWISLLPATLCCAQQVQVLASNTIQAWRLLIQDLPDEVRGALHVLPIPQQAHCLSGLIEWLGFRASLSTPSRSLVSCRACWESDFALPQKQNLR